MTPPLIQVRTPTIYVHNCYRNSVHWPSSMDASTVTCCLQIPDFATNEKKKSPKSLKSNYFIHFNTSGHSLSDLVPFFFFFFFCHFSKSSLNKP